MYRYKSTTWATDHNQWAQVPTLEGGSNVVHEAART